MAEKVVIDQRIHNPVTFNYKQIDVTLEKLRERMKVHPISNIEGKMESFENSDPKEISFGKWLALNINQQIIWTSLKQEAGSKVQYKDDMSESGMLSQDPVVVLKYIQEEKYLRIAAMLDDFMAEHRIIP